MYAKKHRAISPGYHTGWLRDLFCVVLSGGVRGYFLVLGENSRIPEEHSTNWSQHSSKLPNARKHPTNWSQLNAKLSNVSQLFGKIAPQLSKFSTISFGKPK